MSGEVVIVSAFATGAGLAVAAAGSALLAARLVAAWMEEQHAQAQDRIRQEKARITSWQAYHKAQQARQAELTQRQQQTRQRMASLRLNPLDTVTQEQQESQTRGFIYSDQDCLIHKLQPLFASIPAQELEDTSSPLARLHRQVEALDQQLLNGRPPDKHTLTTVQQTVELTVQSYLQELQQQQEHNTRLLCPS